MGRSGCRLQERSGSKALVFPLHTNAQPQHRRAAPAVVLFPLHGSQMMFPLSQQHTELEETCAISAAAAMPEDLIDLLRPKSLPCPAPHFPARGLACRSC